MEKRKIILDCDPGHDDAIANDDGSETSGNRFIRHHYCSG